MLKRRMEFYFIYLISCSIKLCVSTEFVRANLFQRISYRLEIYEPSVVHDVVTSFLGSCTLTSGFEVRGFGQCLGKCTLNTQCMALTYTRDVGCMHCLPSEADGTGNGRSVSLNHMMLSMIHLLPFYEALNRAGKLNLFLID